ncbi:excinuclease ABC subunit UvrA, partial [Leyella stercorea]|uniref:excinuclease ABC subunit UvrA n=1 Tax=Leyella stercorea TaxID=363265 RepID=UPI003AF53249
RMNDKIIIHGAREHNLKNIDLEVPRDKLVVFTGLSGSGKSSLAFDTIYADGQRRYMESLSSYARQFLGMMEKPDVDEITGLSPAISIDQKTTSKNPRSTVGTVTEIYDYLRLLYARIGIPHCPVCGREIRQQTVDQMVDKIMELPQRTKIQILAPIVRGKKGTHQKEFERAKKSGYVRVRVDGNLYELSEEIALEKNKKHNIEIVVDRLVVREDIQSRLTDSLETAIGLTGGLVLVDVIDGEEMLFSQNYACPEHNISIEELNPRMFSFNNPFGACEKCTGLGTFMSIDPDLVIPDKDKSIREGAIRASGWYYAEGGIAQMYYQSLSEHYHFSLDTPIKELPKQVVDILLYGTKGEKIKMVRDTQDIKSTYYTEFEGVANNLERRFRETSSNWMREEITTWMNAVDCPQCHGDRLKKESLSVLIGGMNISQLCRLSVTAMLDFFDQLQLTEKEQQISHQVIKEIRSRLEFLRNVGLEYLTLSRASATLSGGESQRIRLATQIGSSLMGVLYILDEPSIGLHQRDNDRLIHSLKELRDMGNTVVVVEHDRDMMLNADYIVDIGPKAGVRGGEVVFQGTPEQMLKEHTITADYLNGLRKIEIPEHRREGNGKSIVIRGAKGNNLKNVDVEFPLGKLIVVTGVSGSGKSTLINETLQPILSQHFYRSLKKPMPYDSIEGIENIDKVVNVDQSPIGRTPRSNPATYTGVFNDIRAMFVNLPEAKIRGYKPGRFSFNVKGGRCETCKGGGYRTIEMNFLPDVLVPCEVCHGKRYNRETLEVRYKGKSIADVLDMTFNQAVEFFENVPNILQKIKTVKEVGLGYIKLGQPSTTLSGGECQRVKLATELSKRDTGKTLYILDEPTTGLHFEDIKILMEVLQKLVDRGNTVIIIEHNLDVIKLADYIIDMGPEGGRGGGQLLAKGTPEEVSECKESYTAKFLKQELE